MNDGGTVFAYRSGVTGRRAVMVLIAVAALAVAATSVVRTVRGFYRLDFPVSWLESGVRVEEVPDDSSAHSAGLLEGDVVVRVDGRPVTRLDDPLTALAVGDEHELGVIGRDGQLRSAAFASPPPRLDLVFLARCLVALIGLGFAVTTVLRTRRPEAPTFVLLAAAALIVATVPHRTAATHVVFGFLHRMAGASIWYLLIRFFALFPDGRRFPRTADVAAAVAAVCAGLTAAVPSWNAHWPHVLVGLRVLFGIGLLTAAVLQVRRWRRAAREASVRRQIEWASLGMVVGLLPYVGLVMLPDQLGIPVPAYSWLAVLPIALVPVGFATALAEYRLWDLEAITRDSLTAVILVVTGGLGFAIVNQLLLTYGHRVGSLRNLLAFTTGVLIVVLLLPLRTTIGVFLDRWLYHGRPAPRRLLTASSRDLARSTEPEDILRRLAEALTQGLEVDTIATYVRTADGPFELVYTALEGMPHDLPARVADAPYPISEESALAEAGHDQRVPLERGGTVHGLLYVGRRRGIFPLGSEAREVVDTFTAQAALGLESARRLEDLRRRAEAYRVLHANTQRIIESSAAGILVCDTTGRILSTNLRATEILERDAAALAGRALRDLIELPDTWRDRLPPRAIGVEGQTRDDPGKQVLVTVSILELESGHFDGRVVVLQDVTELRALERQLQEHRRLAALGRLASGLAHEINTPLTGISSYAQMLSGMISEDEPTAELVRKLERQSYRVSRIVGNLLEVARSESRRTAVIDLAEEAADTAREVVDMLENGDRLEITPARGPIRIRGSSGAVRLAVSNVVRNALEAAGEKGTVHMYVTSDETIAEVVVDDDGPGISDAIRERVFEPFFTTRSDRGGTGLGLAISRDILRQLGGEIVLEDSPLGGARVRLQLPRWTTQQPSSSSTTSRSSRTS